MHYYYYCCCCYHQHHHCHYDKNCICSSSTQEIYFKTIKKNCNLQQTTKDILNELTVYRIKVKTELLKTENNALSKFNYKNANARLS